MSSHRCVQPLSCPTLVTAHACSWPTFPPIASVLQLLCDSWRWFALACVSRRRLIGLLIAVWSNWWSNDYLMFVVNSLTDQRQTWASVAFFAVYKSVLAQTWFRQARGVEGIKGCIFAYLCSSTCYLQFRYDTLSVALLCALASS